MKKEDIPQDASKLEQMNIRELYYVLDKDGKYTTGLSTGWTPKSIALDLSIENLQEEIEDAKQEVYANKKSPVYYFMLVEKMDLGLLSSYMGKFRWIIKRHFKPNVFKKLNRETLMKYATIFDIDVKRLENFNE